LNYFVSRGIPKGRFKVIGMGSKDPVADNSTPEGRAKNRRVEIIRIDK
jgi:outer membrane protein OmpA-like peptidoglycan-associated protein